MSMKKTSSFLLTVFLVLIRINSSVFSDTIDFGKDLSELFAEDEFQSCVLFSEMSFLV